MRDDRHDEIKAELFDRVANWERRLNAIRTDRRHERVPLDTNLEDQAVQRENDATLDALDALGRRELESIRSALQRIESGTFGRCLRCGGAIRAQRLEALPTAEHCNACSQGPDATE